MSRICPQELFSPRNELQQIRPRWVNRGPTTLITFIMDEVRHQGMRELVHTLQRCRHIRQRNLQGLGGLIDFDHTVVTLGRA